MVPAAGRCLCRRADGTPSFNVPDQAGLGERISLDDRALIRGKKSGALRSDGAIIAPGYLTSL